MKPFKTVMNVSLRMITVLLMEYVFIAAKMKKSISYMYGESAINII